MGKTFLFLLGSTSQPAHHSLPLFPSLASPADQLAQSASPTPAGPALPLVLHTHPDPSSPPFASACTEAGARPLPSTHAQEATAHTPPLPPWPSWRPVFTPLPLATGNPRGDSYPKQPPLPPQGGGPCAPALSPSMSVLMRYTCPNMGTEARDGRAALGTLDT